MTNRVTRLAPSPTGALHLGNARTFLINWAIARSRGWNILMRMEDLDGPRIKRHAAEEALDLLRWLGLDHDGEVLWQSRDLEPYRGAIRDLAGRGLVYSCDLSRREIEAASTAPHVDEHELRYPPELRPKDADRYRFEHEQTNYRLLVEPETIAIDDAIHGTVTMSPDEEVGDFVIWTRRAVPAYQLAVVVDDARQGMTDVIRGDDLLPSAARQKLLYRALNLQPPRWWHLPLVLGPDGRRLAKRHGDTRLATYREQGVTPQRIIGLLAAWSGIDNRSGGRIEAISAEEFRDAFSVDTLPRTSVTFTEDDHRWLMQ